MIDRLQGDDGAEVRGEIQAAKKLVGGRGNGQSLRHQVGAGTDTTYTIKANTSKVIGGALNLAGSCVIGVTFKLLIT